MDAKLELTVAGQFENLAKIREFVERLAALAQLDERASYAFQMAVDEACTNIIEHAYGGEGSNSIRLLGEPHPDGLAVIIYDQGQPFAPTQPPTLDTEAPLENRQAGGMGLFFIYKLVDQVEFAAGTAQGNRLRLFKRRGSA